jgi:hypothetical protein
MYEMSGEQERRANEQIRKALEVQADPIDLALLAIEGDRTVIMTDATGTAREVTFVAPGFPPTYEG